MILFALALAHAAQDTALPPLPKAVAAFVERYQECEHWAGEEPYDAPRRHEIERGIARACKGIDKTAAKLRSRHARDARVQAELAKYPPMNN